MNSRKLSQEQVAFLQEHGWKFYAHHEDENEILHPDKAHFDCGHGHSIPNHKRKHVDSHELSTSHHVCEACHRHLQELMGVLSH